MSGRREWRAVVASLGAWILALEEADRPHCACCGCTSMLSADVEDSCSDSEDGEDSCSDSEDVDTVRDDSDDELSESDDSEFVEDVDRSECLVPLCSRCQRAGCTVEILDEPEEDSDLGRWWE